MDTLVGAVCGVFGTVALVAAASKRTDEPTTQESILLTVIAYGAGIDARGGQFAAAIALAVVAAIRGKSVVKAAIRAVRRPAE